MKISLNWLKEYTDINLGIDELVEKIGAQLGAVEEVIDLGKKYQGIVIAKVVSCVQHPNADRLHVCTIDDGGVTPDVNRDENGNVQVVCGAPNVREGLTVVWIPPGSTVPSSFDEDPFVLDARELRGVVSNGMLASAKELAISDSHAGILEVDDDKAPGMSFAEAYQLNDYIIDIENKMFTHRPDCFGVLGVAREIAGITGQQFSSPEWYNKENSFVSQHDDAVKSLGVHVEIPELCPRYMAIVINGIKVAPSPAWLQSYLSRVGIRPINNIVDMTNYIMMTTAQPLHAFDFDKIAIDGNAQLVVRKPREGEKLELLNGKTIEPRADAVLIATPEKAIALGGMMGGNNSEIDENTTRIVIECANFDMYNIRKTSMEHGLFTDAVTRFNKGQSPWQCPPVLYKAVQLTGELCPGAQAVGESVDANNAHKKNKPVTVSAEFVNTRLGTALPMSEMASLLRNVEFDVQENGESLAATVPFWRTDIEIPEDIVEEVGRLYGFDKLPVVLPQRGIEPATKDATLELKNKIRDALSQAGANEVLTYSFVHGNLFEKATQNKDKAFELSNALSPDLQYFRLGLTPSLLEKVHMNIKAGYDEFGIFEIGKAHGKNELDEEGLPCEFGRTAFVFAADTKVVKEKYAGAAYYEAQKYLTTLLDKCGNWSNLTLIPLLQADLGGHEMIEQMVAPYEPARAAVLHNGQYICGVVGEYKRSVAKALKLPDYCGGFEVFMSAISSLALKSYVPLPKYPKVEQDLSLRVPQNVSYAELENVVSEALIAQKSENIVMNLEPLDIYQREDDQTSKQFAFRFTVTSYEKTLKAEEVNAMLDAAAEAAKQAYGAERI